MNYAQIAPRGQRRNAPDSVYPLRGADGLTFAERKELAMRKNAEMRAALDALPMRQKEN